MAGHGVSGHGEWQGMGCQGMESGRAWGVRAWRVAGHGVSGHGE